MFSDLQDTIVAISSAPGCGPRGVLRLSGPRAIELAAAVFFSPVEARVGFRRYHGAVRWTDESLGLPAELYVFRSPRSFTRQDVAEIHTVGSPPILASLLERLVHAGARLAEPGEFTARAFLAGAMDLTAVEGIAAMINAGSDAELRAAEQLLHGTLARRTQALHLRIANLLALVEASIDFVDEPIDFLSPEQAAEELTAIVVAVQDILAAGTPMERLDARCRVALLGPPNAGKSTLFNRLTGLNRAICSSAPGTTRDVIGAPVSLTGGAELWLMDSAGVGSPSDPIGRRAEDFAREAAASADLVLFVVDGARSHSPSMLAIPPGVHPSRTMVVINKLDLPGVDQVAKKISTASSMPVLAISASTGLGCPQLLATVSELLHLEPIHASAASIAMNARHRLALAAASSACGRALELVRKASSIDAAELIALELREASRGLGSVVGEITTEEVLDSIFSRFCIGK